MTDAAVGSISHILQTAFKEDYEERNKINESKARKLAIEERRKERERKRQLAEERKKEEEERLAAEATASKKGAKKPETSAEPSQDEDDEPEEEELDEGELYENPVDKIPLSEHHRSLLEGRVERIQSEIEENSKDAERLVTYLKQQREIAKQLEIEEEENLKKQGIMIGQHIPSLVSQLDVDPNVVNGFGKIGANLVISRELLGQNKERNLRRTGNLPISDEAELRKTQRKQYKDTEVEDVPHYLQHTGAFKERSNITAARFSSTLQEHKTHRETIALEHTAKGVDIKKIPKRDWGQSAIERDQDQAVLKSINHRLNYLRNPRNNPSAVTKTLVAPSIGTHRPGGSVKSGRSQHSSGVSVDSSVPPPPPAPRSTNKSVIQSGRSGHKTKRGIGSSTTAVAGNALFVTEPSCVLFDSYDVGEKYVQSVAFRNISSVCRTLRVIPPRTVSFSMSPLRFPANSKGGVVAPGMCVTSDVTFYPKSLADYTDSIHVETEGGDYSVQLLGRRDPPVLNLPSLLDVGACLVGDALRISVPCGNSGGAGKFKVLRSDWYPEIPDDVDYTGCVRSAPFTVYPIEFSLERRDSIDLTIEFVPLDIGQFQRNFVFLGDNEQYITVTLQGEGRQVECAVTEINSITVPAIDPTILKDLHFANCPIGSDHEQEITVSNTSGLPIEYEWVWVESRTKDIRMASLGKLMIKEEQLEDDRERRERLKAEAAAADARRLSIDSKRSGQRTGNKTAGGQSLYNRGDTDMMKSTGLSVEHGFEESAVMKGFGIMPRRGVLPAYGSSPFVVKYTASNVGLDSARAVLVLRDVTESSMPGKSQSTSIVHLLDMAHGPYHRLQSWLDEIGVEVPSASLKHEHDDLFMRGLRPHNVPSNRISMDTLMSIARNHASVEGLQSSLSKFRFTVGRLLSKARRWIHRTTETDVPDDDSVIGADLMEQEEPDNESVVLDDAFAMATIQHWDANDDSLAATFPMFKVEIPRDFESHMVSSRKYINPDSDEAKSISKVLWINNISAFSVLGSGLCTLLNEKVKHEAVDFIQRCSRINLPALNMNVTGVGVLPTFHLTPPKLIVGGAVSVGKEWTGTVTLHNTSHILNEVSIDTSAAVIPRIGNKENATITVSNSHIILLPGSTETINVTVVVNEVGDFDITLPVIPKSEFLEVNDIIISIHTVGPKIRFEAPEVNIGLVSTGVETQSVVSFTNDTDIPLIYNLSCSVDALLSALSTNRRNERRESKFATPPRIPSTPNEDVQSVAHSARSTRSQLTEASTDSYAIENPTAVFSFMPPSGELGPGETCHTTLRCVAGKFPQRVRGVIECKVTDINGVCNLPSQYISVRGEVQSPLTILTPSLVDVGNAYINTPIKFEITLKNLTSLGSKFKFERPGGDSASYKLQFSEKSGDLQGQEKRVITVTFTALVSGVTDDVIGCKIFGSPNPIGFQLKGIAKGIHVDFVPLEEGEEPPLPLADPTEPQYPGPGSVPDPAPLRPLEFGSEVELYERRIRQFAIRNLSAVSAFFDIRPRKYEVGEVFNDDDSLTSSLAEPPAVGKGLLVPNEDGEARYQSEAGKKYIGAMMKRRQDKHYLTLGLGASYAVEPKTGVVPPWGVVVVTVLSRNDMPGCFDDELVCDFRDHRKMFLPMKMNVLGCPLVIERDSYGMSSFTPPEGRTEESSGLLLQMGYSAVNSEPIVRDFRVRNNGSSPATIKWKLRSVSSRVNGPLKVELRLQKTGVKTHLLFWDDVAKDSPFDVDPKVTVIPAYGRRNFKVKLLRTNVVGNELALLSGAISFDSSPSDMSVPPTRESISGGGSRPGEAAAPESKQSMVESSSAASVVSQAAKSAVARVSYNISLHLKGSLMQPEIRLDKNILVTTKDRVTHVPSSLGIVLKTDAPSLFAKGARPSDVCKRVIALMNPIPATLAFSVSVEGPFTVKLLSDENKQRPKSPSSVHTSNTLSSRLSKGQSSTAGGSSVGGTCLLLSQASVRFVVAFTPRRELRNTLQNNKSTLGLGDKAADGEKGTLIVSFSTGQQLHVPITVTLSTPFISASSPRLHFGVCHTTRHCDGILLLSSSTDVIARWSVEHVPGAGGSRKVSSIRVKGFESLGQQEDDPSVFTITPGSGELQGPTVSPTAATYCPPKDVNRSQSIAVIEQRPMATSWATSTLTLQDSLVERHQSSKKNAIDARYPIPINIKFKPSRNVRYSSRFRFTCEYGNTFDVLLEGEGTFEEHEHRPLNPVPR